MKPELRNEKIQVKLLFMMFSFSLLKMDEDVMSSN